MGSHLAWRGTGFAGFRKQVRYVAFAACTHRQPERNRDQHGPNLTHVVASIPGVILQESPENHERDRYLMALLTT